jgi:hypothetical protein
MDPADLSDDQIGSVPVPAAGGRRRVRLVSPAVCFGVSLGLGIALMLRRKLLEL